MSKQSRRTGGGRRHASTSGAAAQPPRGQAQATSMQRPSKHGNQKPAKPRLTHFLSIPLGHHSGLRESISTFTNSLLNSKPPIPGLDKTIVVPARRLHLTLGVMSLSDESHHVPLAPDREQTKTIGAALALLQDLRPDVLDILKGSPLRVRLNHVGIMDPPRGDPEQAHVMWLGPSVHGEEGKRLEDLCVFLHRAFIKAGLSVDERRPLKLHCTVINTTYRKPRGRVPFSFPAIVASRPFAAIASPQPSGSNSVARTGDGASRGFGPFDVEFGEWSVGEVQICEMGSKGPEGEYVSVGGISLV